MQKGKGRQELILGMAAMLLVATPAGVIGAKLKWLVDPCFALPQHVIPEFLSVGTHSSQFGERVPEDLVGMGFLVILKRTPIGHDGIMLLGAPGLIERALVRNETGELEYLPCDESSFVAAIGILDHAA